MAKDELKVFSPYDEHYIDSVSLVDKNQMEDFISKAHKLVSDPDQHLSVPDRRKILEKTVSIIEERFDDFVKTAAEEGGKPLVDSRVEVQRAMQGIHVAIEHMGHMTGHEIPMNQTASSLNRLAYTFREPVGIVAAVSAFNHPFNLAIHQIIPAIATSCPVIIKPAGTTPLSCQNIIRTLYEAGVPKEWCSFAPCKHDVAEQLISDPRIGFFSFIGSGKVGWRLRSMLPPGVGCALEHGGVAPVIVESDADLETAIPILTKGGYYHAGQVCVSVQRVYAHKSIVNQLTKGIQAAAEKLVVGDSLDEKTEVGPLIQKKEVERVANWVDEAKERGAKLLCGGEKIGETCYSPTLLVDPPDDATVSKLEVFGPVVCVYPYDDYRDAIKRANSLPYSFQAAVFTKNIDVGLDCVKRLNAKAVMVNDHTAFRVDWMPFGGAKESGIGVGGIPYSMHEMTQEKLMVIKSPSL